MEGEVVCHSQEIGRILGFWVTWLFQSKGLLAKGLDTLGYV